MTPDELTVLLDEAPPDLDKRLSAMMEWRAVLILDMAGFSSTAANEGIISALKRIRNFQTYSARCIEIYGGKVVKYYADNVLASFCDLESARLAALDATAFNDASAGIAEGYVLPVTGDLYGMPVNVASRLGEDEAEAGEVLEAPSPAI